MSHIESPFDEVAGYWASGLVDGEGCFFLMVKLRYDRPYVYFKFEIGLREDDKETLEKLQRALGGFGCIRTNNSNRSVALHVSRRDELLVVADFFERYPLRSKKRIDFEIWASALRYYDTKRGQGISSGELFEEMQTRAQQIRDNRKFEMCG
jgi:hypothetical protein